MFNHRKYVGNIIIIKMPLNKSKGKKLLSRDSVWKGNQT